MKLNVFAKKLTDIVYNSNFDDIEILQNWALLKKEVNETDSHSGNVSNILKILKNIKKPKEEIKILDFGCGGCTSIFYLIALGYTNVWGIDLEVKFELDIFLKKILSENSNSKKRISNYKKLPLDFEDNEFDFIFTQQVFEHVRFDDYMPALKEISRLLKIDAITYNQIPHKLVPYESHTKTWLIHWLPKNMIVFFFKLFGKNSSFIKEHLWFKFPWEYMSSFDKIIGPTQNLSYDRISEFTDTSVVKPSGEILYEFQGLSRFLRILIAKLSKNKIIGKSVKFCFVYFIMLELVSKKKNV
jgi:SAM-dependent methyltransferase